MGNTVVSLRLNQDTVQFLDDIRGDLTRGECAKVIIMWLQSVDVDNYAKRQVEHYTKTHQPRAATSSSSA